jgi:hypothetical protein
VVFVVFFVITHGGGGGSSFRLSTGVKAASDHLVSWSQVYSVMY